MSSSSSVAALASANPEMPNRVDRGPRSAFGRPRNPSSSGTVSARRAASTSSRVAGSSSVADVLQEFHQHAAGADRHHRPEQRITGDADDQFGDPAAHHALDIEAGAERRGLWPRRGPTLVAKVEADRAGLGFVGDAERLDRDREAEPLGGGDGLVRARGAPPGGTASPAPASRRDLASASSG